MSVCCIPHGYALLFKHTQSDIYSPDTQAAYVMVIRKLRWLGEDLEGAAAFISVCYGTDEARAHTRAPALIHLICVFWIPDFEQWP